MTISTDVLHGVPRDSLLDQCETLTNLAIVIRTLFRDVFLAVPTEGGVRAHLSNMTLLTEDILHRWQIPSVDVRSLLPHVQSKYERLVSYFILHRATQQRPVQLSPPKHLERMRDQTNESLRRILDVDLHSPSVISLDDGEANDDTRPYLQVTGQLLLDAFHAENLFASRPDDGELQRLLQQCVNHARRPRMMTGAGWNVLRADTRVRAKTPTRPASAQPRARTSPIASPRRRRATTTASPVQFGGLWEEALNTILVVVLTACFVMLGRTYRRIANPNHVAEPPNPVAEDDERSLCYHCVDRTNRCPMHPDCELGECRSHPPNWVQFCKNRPLTDAQRRHLVRWVQMLQPDLPAQDVKGMSDAQLCDALAQLDAEWRRDASQCAKRHPDGTRDENPDLLSYNDFHDLSHEVIGTFRLPRANDIQCADLKNLRDQTVQTFDKHFIPHWQWVKGWTEEPYYRGLFRDWRARADFYDEQFVEPDALPAPQVDVRRARDQQITWPVPRARQARQQAEADEARRQADAARARQARRLAEAEEARRQAEEARRQAEDAEAEARMQAERQAEEARLQADAKKKDMLQLAEEVATRARQQNALYKPFADERNDRWKYVEVEARRRRVEDDRNRTPMNVRIQQQAQTVSETADRLVPTFYHFVDVAHYVFGQRLVEETIRLVGDTLGRRYIDAVQTQVDDASAKVTTATLSKYHLMHRIATGLIAVNRRSRPMRRSICNLLDYCRRYPSSAWADALVDVITHALPLPVWEARQRILAFFAQSVEWTDMDMLQCELAMQVGYELYDVNMMERVTHFIVHASPWYYDAKTQSMPTPMPHPSHWTDVRITSAMPRAVESGHHYMAVDMACYLGRTEEEPTELERQYQRIAIEAFASIPQHRVTPPVPPSGSSRPTPRLDARTPSTSRVGRDENPAPPSGSRDPQSAFGSPLSHGDHRNIRALAMQYEWNRRSSDVHEALVRNILVRNMEFERDNGDIHLALFIAVALDGDSEYGQNVLNIVDHMTRSFRERLEASDNSDEMR